MLLNIILLVCIYILLTRDSRQFRLIVLLLVTSSLMELCVKGNCTRRKSCFF